MRPDEPAGQTQENPDSQNTSWIVWLAQGFGLGKLPLAPGTFGSLLGLAWFSALVWTANAWLYAAGLVLGLASSVWIAGRAERIMGQTDPPSVVIDEITAVPLCFAAWITIEMAEGGTIPALQHFLSGTNLFWSLILFTAFRLFDALKPWPIRQSQCLPGGWGITADDILAALWSNACFAPLYLLRQS